MEKERDWVENDRSGVVKIEQTDSSSMAKLKHAYATLRLKIHRLFVPKHRVTGCLEYGNRRPKPASREAMRGQQGHARLSWLEFSVCSTVFKLISRRK